MAENTKNPKLYREMSEPHASVEAFNESLDAFYVKLSELREKYQLADLYVIVADAYLSPEGQETDVITRFSRGNTMKASILTGWAFGYEQSEYQNLIAGVVTRAKKSK